MSDGTHKSKSPEQLAKLPIIGKQPSNEKEENFLREICEFEFHNVEEPGVCNKFSYGEVGNQHTFTLFDGGKYFLPRFIARHIESRSTPIWKWRPKGDGTMEKQLVTTKSRFTMKQSFN